jgi:hypothetical protein
MMQGMQKHHALHHMSEVHIWLSYHAHTSYKVDIEHPLHLNRLCAMVEIDICKLSMKWCYVIPIWNFSDVWYGIY